MWSEMQPSSQRLVTRAWLLRGISSLPGQLSLRDGRLCFRAHGPGNFWPSQLRKLEQQLRVDELAVRLEREESLNLFDLPLHDITRIHFPWYTFSGGMNLLIHGVWMRFGFDHPANSAAPPGGLDPLGEISSARKAGKAWKMALGL